MKTWINECLDKNNKIEMFLQKHMGADVPLYLYGNGKAVRFFIEFMNKHQLHVNAIIDSRAVSGTYCFGIPVILFDEAVKKSPKANVVISAPAHIKDIEITIKNNSNYNIFVFDPLLDVIQRCCNKDRRHFYINNAERFQALYDELNDNISKQTFKKVIGGALTADISYYKGLSYKSQYFPDFVVNKLSTEEVFIDLGAFDGDSLREFIDVTNGVFEQAVCFEPDVYNYDKLINCIGDDNRIVAYNKGVGEKKSVMYLVNNNGTTLDESAFLTRSITKNKVEVVSLDEELKGIIPTYIKMDIEGAEIDAIKGAKTIISQYHPNLAISVYHKCEDIVDIPEVIKELYPKYQFYLRHYWETTGTDTVLFAMSK